MKILVLGATGVIGRRVVPLLLARGYSVTAAGRSRERLAAHANLGAHPAVVDVVDRDAVARLVPGHSVVVNLATAVPLGPRALLPSAWRAMDRVRRDGSANVARAALATGVERLIQESFALTYPDSSARWVDESTPPRPAGYNRTTLDAESAAHRMTAAGRVGVALRFALFYGGVEDPFTRDVLQYTRRGWLPFPGRADAYLATVTHEDAARAVVSALTAPPGVYNVVDDEPLTRRELAGVLGTALGVRAPKLPPSWMTSLAGPVGQTIARSLRLSNRAFREGTGWTPLCPSGREGWQEAAERRTKTVKTSAKHAGAASA